MGDSSTCLLAECRPATTRYPPAAPPLLQWLMIGDSISLQVATHEGFAAEAARRGWQVVHSHGNACGVLRAARCLDSWLEEESDGGGARWDVISFNFGLHDLSWTAERVEPDAYATAVRALAERLRRAAPRASLLWATTTPVPRQMMPKAGLASVSRCLMAASHTNNNRANKNGSSVDASCRATHSSADPPVYNAAAACALRGWDAAKATPSGSTKHYHPSATCLNFSAPDPPLISGDVNLYLAVRDRCGSFHLRCSNVQRTSDIHFEAEGVTLLAKTYLDAMSELMARGGPRQGSGPRSGQESRVSRRKGALESTTSAHRAAS